MLQEQIGALKFYPLEAPRRAFNGQPSFSGGSVENSGHHSPTVWYPCTRHGIGIPGTAFFLRFQKVDFYYENYAHFLVVRVSPLSSLPSLLLLYLSFRHFVSRMCPVRAGGGGGGGGDGGVSLVSCNSDGNWD